MRTLRLLLLPLLLASCSTFTAPPLVISGEALKAVGIQFVATATAVTNACVAKTLTMKQCDAFRSFEAKFKLAYPPAVTVQQVAMSFGDQTMAQNAATIIAGLVKELAPYTALIGGK